MASDKIDPGWVTNMILQNASLTDLVQCDSQRGATLASLHDQGILARLSIGVDNWGDAVARRRRSERCRFTINLFPPASLRRPTTLRG